jgi:hypothetical protein
MSVMGDRFLKERTLWYGKEMMTCSDGPAVLD